MLAITANVPTSQFNRSPFQEINKHFQADFPNIIRPVVKRSFQPTRVDMLPLALRRGHDHDAVRAAPGAGECRRAVQRVPGGGRRRDAAAGAAAAIRSAAAHRRTRYATALDMLAAAKRPVLFIGHGVTLSEAGRN